MLRFKAATWQIEKLESWEIGLTNLHDILKKNSYTRPVWPQVIDEEVGANMFKCLFNGNNHEPYFLNESNLLNYIFLKSSCGNKLFF